MSTPAGTVVAVACRSVGHNPTRLLDVAREVQSRLGCVSPDAIDAIHRSLGVPRVDVQGLVSFYSFLSETPQGRIVIRLCDDVVDRLAGYERVRARSPRSSGSSWARPPPTARSRERTACIGMSDQEPAALVGSKRYNPAFAKADLFRLGYIATRSGHSTGAALDLSLVDLKADNSATFDPAKDYGDCTANAGLRAPDGSVDMGTGYDCLDVKSHTAAKSITAAQRRWRETLVLVMARRGFVKYSKEWWHFSLPGASGQAYDFPITPRK